MLHFAAATAIFKSSRKPRMGLWLGVELTGLEHACLQTALGVLLLLAPFESVAVRARW